MPRPNQSNESEAEAGESTSLLHTGTTQIASAWANFTDFIFSDNVLEVAVGLIIARAFTSLITTFVSSLLLPLIGLVPGLGGRNFADLFVVLRSGSSDGDVGVLVEGGVGVGAEGMKGKYNTVEQARDDGALVLAYGLFVDSLLNFLILGLSLYLIAQAYQSCSGDRVVKRTVKCKYCRKRISDKAKRCFNCTSWQDGRED